MGIEMYKARIDEEGNDKTGLSDNNSFLHDNVD